MCWLTPRARAATLWNDEQVRLEQTLNARTLPTVGGVTRAGVMALDARGAGAGAAAGRPYARVRAMPRSTPSNAAAMGDWPDSSPPGGASAAAAAIAVVVAPRSWNGDASPNVPAADCGTSTYSAVSTNALAANCTHPESVPGSIVT